MLLNLMQMPCQFGKYGESRRDAEKAGVEQAMMPHTSINGRQYRLG